MRGLPLPPRAAELAGAVALATSGNGRRPALRVLISAGTALSALLLPAVYQSRLRLVWNVSASVPVGLYRIVPASPLRRGELVAVRPSPALARYMAARRYVEANALLVKPIGAVAGQRVCRAGAVVTIDGAQVATALAADHLRRPLPVWTGCRRLRPGTVFLLAPRAPASFDGRYFGPVTTISIVGRALPLWTQP